MKDVNEMGRTELIDALRTKVHPKVYHATVLKPTAQLRAILAYFRSPLAERSDGWEPAEDPDAFMVSITIDYSRHG